MRILVTGSRYWEASREVEAAIHATAPMDCQPEEVVIVHGGARGVDSWAGRVARYYGFTEEVHPAGWSKHGKAAGAIRNQQMVDAGADVCLAFPRGESRGTRDCIRRAKAAGIPVRVIEEEA